jgi:citronellyl-CoA dehydrogenase
MPPIVDQSTPSTDDHDELDLSIDDLRKMAREFVKREIDPHCAEWEEAKIFPAHELFAKAGEAGLLGVSKDPRWGGLGLSFSHTVALAEEWGRCQSAAVAMALGVQTDMATPALHNFGSDHLRETYLKPAVEGEMVACVGVSETTAGSDVAAVQTTARKDGGDYVISGHKMWITNGMQADWMCCLANTSDGRPHANKSLILVPLDAPGVERSRKLHKMGMWASDTAQIFFDEVRVPQRNLIGIEGGGFMLQMMQFQDERLWGAANCIGSLEECIRLTIDQTRLRQAFGKSILDNQVVHHRLAELSTELECLRALVWRTTQMYQDEVENAGGGPIQASNEVVRLASMCKLKAGRLSREVADACLQYWGGMGYMWESPVSRFFRDGRLVSIGGGADEIMLNIICKLEGTLPSRKEELHKLAAALGYELTKKGR